MKIEDQVITKEQSIRLSSLFIIAPSIWYWVYPRKEDMVSTTSGVCHVNWAKEIIQDNEGDEFDNVMTAAYGVAELGVMLPAEIKECKLTQWPISYLSGTKSYGMQYRYKCDSPVTNQVIPEHCIFGFSEADVRANLLINLLESKVITAEEVNERLCA